MVVRVEHGDLAAGLQRREQVNAQWVEDGRAGDAGIVVVDAGAGSSPVAKSMRDVMARTVFWN